MEVDACGKHAYCNDTEGSFNCLCEKGFGGKPPEIPCLNVNECESRNDNCGPHSSCVNSNGSYECTCFNGFSRTLEGSCSDIDECSSGKAEPAFTM